ncbi:choice-of-anchor B family protein [Salisaeta longa]|uniref:choice-of-anchor B family protein n=1 Tax=Salisaeta longa TaxID=503170 RepID=UPI00146B7F40|nr:choice-of-anchor B family protein [Salisaeta longa]
MWPLSVHAQSAPFARNSAMMGFGQALAVHEGTVFIGEPRAVHTPGRVYLYTQQEGAWQEAAVLEAQDGAVQDGFGSALSVDGTTLASASSDAVYIFNKSGSDWTQAAKLTVPDSISGFGSSIALDGDWLAVGASSRASVGRVFVYRRTDAGWAQTATLVGSSAQKGNRFGGTVALQDGHLLAGAAGQETGVVYAFRYDADAEAWNEVGQLMRSQLNSAARFGSTIALHDGTAFIGAPRADEAAGRVFTFAFNDTASTWEHQHTLYPLATGGEHYFGASLAFAGDQAWIGAPGADDRTGALYRYTWSDGNWTAAQHVALEATKTGQMAGASLAASDDVVATGRLGADYGAGTATILWATESGWKEATVASAPADVMSSITGNKVRCTDGTAKMFECQNVDLVSFLPVHKIGGGRGVQVNDIWGWTDPETGREYALVGRIDGTSFVDVTDPSNPVYLGSLPRTEGSTVNVWRDVKVYKNHAYVVADNAGEHGMQIFDLTQLRDVSPSEAPVTFEETAHYDKIHSAHNVVINTDTGYAYIVGSSGGGQTCGGGLHMVNIENPTEPEFAGCFADPSTGRTGTGYSHDAQCVVYNGPDKDYQGREICFGANETAISIADVTNKDEPVAVSTGTYPDHAYVHQGWLTEDHRYFIQNDELDEIQGLADSTRALVWDVTDLDNPKLATEYFFPNRSTDHNMYIRDGLAYQSNYVSGLHILDVSNPTAPRHVAEFDTVPFGKDEPGFAGTWSNYPFFDSGIIIMTSMNEGLFILRRQQESL